MFFPGAQRALVPSHARPVLILIRTHPRSTDSCVRVVQSSVQTFLPGFGNGWRKYCAIVHFLDGQWNILKVKVILGTEKGMFFTTMKLHVASCV